MTTACLRIHWPHRPGSRFGGLVVIGRRCSGGHASCDEDTEDRLGPCSRIREDCVKVA
jgi:hypothetical protein